MHNKLFQSDGSFPQYLAIERRDRNNQKINKDLVRAITSVIPKDETIIDIGAGSGRFVYALLEQGYKTVGIDGTEGIEELSRGLIHYANLTEDCSKFHKCADWGLFLEVGEHVSEEHEMTVLNQVAQIPKSHLIVSWAIPGQQGRHHVNCLWPDDVTDKFAQFGWFVDPVLTQKIRIEADCYYDRRLLALCH